jgi:hypothetical protein
MLQKIAAMSNIGSFVLAIYVIFWPEHGTVLTGQINPLFWLFLAGLIVAGLLNFIAFRNQFRGSATPKRLENHETETKSTSGSPTLRFSPLKSEVLTLGNDLFSFLREVGPDPGNQLDYLHSQEDVWKHMAEKTSPYIQRVHHGYLSRFKDRTVKIFHELAMNGIEDNEIEDWEIDPPQAVKPESVRKIAEHMFSIAAKMDVREASEGT